MKSVASKVSSQGGFTNKMSKHSSIGKASKLEQKAKQFDDKLQYFLDNCKNAHEGAKRDEFG
jgi:hypothetical protein